jgi:succinoglycan biosynthesis protein ExoA
VIAFVTIVVPCRNERGAIERFLESVFAQTDVSQDMEVIVADGASDDGTREVLQRWMSHEPRLRLVENPRKTVSTGLNLAIQASRGEVIVRMDVHTYYAPDYVAECIKALEQTDAANVGGPALTRAVTRFQRANAAAYRSPFSVGGARFHDPNYEGFVDTVTYGCWRRQTLLDAGLFDEEFVRNQDDELNLRLSRAGGKIWQTPRIRSWYFPRSSLGGLIRQYYQYGYWKVRVIEKHRIPASWRHLVPAGVLLLAAFLLLAGLIEPRAWFVLATFATLYLALVLFVSTFEARRCGDWCLLPWLTVIFPAYHWSYALGFARALFDRFARRGRPARSAVGLTR